MRAEILVAFVGEESILFPSERMQTFVSFLYPSEFATVIFVILDFKKIVQFWTFDVDAFDLNLLIFFNTSAAILGIYIDIFTQFFLAEWKFLNLEL